MNDEQLLSLQRAIEIARTSLKGIGNGKIVEAHREDDPPRWVLTAAVDVGSEGPNQLEGIVVRKRLEIDARDGKVLSNERTGLVTYVYPPRYVPKAWSHHLRSAGRRRHVMIYTSRIWPGMTTFFQQRHSRGVTAFEVLVDGEWASGDGHMWYLSYEDALEAAQEALAS